MFKLHLMLMKAPLLIFLHFLLMLDLVLTQILCFFIDTSDRVDKETTESAVLQCLERDASNVVRGSWKTHVEPTVMQDLRRHRTYQGQSIRDLLRALRNKVLPAISFSPKFDQVLKT